MKWHIDFSLNVWTLEDGSDELSRNWHFTLRNIPEERLSHVHRGESTKLRTVSMIFTAFRTLKLSKKTFSMSLTEIRPVVIFRTTESCLVEHGRHVLDWPTVETLSIRQDIEIVEHFKESRTWLVNGTDYSSAALNQKLQVGDHLQRR